MKLPNFNNFLDLNNLVNDMGAKVNPNFNLNVNWNHLTEEELIQLSSEGIEVNLSDIVLKSGEPLEFKGQKVLLYIKEWWFDRRYPDNLPRYHIASCSTLINMNNKGKKERYVVSNNKNSEFTVTFRDSLSRKIIKEELTNLVVCKNCLSSMRSYFSNNKFLFYFDSFDLDTFFSLNNTKHRIIPMQNENNYKINEYTKDWIIISRRYKEKRNWTCECCNKNCSIDKFNLHTHHKNAIKWDNDSNNLEALCVDCHSKEDGHHTLKNSIK